MERKILSLDGGGLKGLFSVTLISEIEEELSCHIYEYFDMIAGTSTGGIIAAGLAMGIPAKEIKELYVQHAKEIFPNDRFKIWKHFGLFKPKYTNEELKKQLEAVFGDATVGMCKTRLLIPSYNLSTGKITVFKTSHAEDLMIDYKRKIVDVIMSTTAAPTYLPPYKTSSGTYIDGGIGANNPSIIALVEAISRCKWDMEHIRMLSVGCTEAIDSSTTGREKLTIIPDALKVLKLFMRAETQYSENISNILLGNNRFLRINPIDLNNAFSLDRSDSKTLDELVVIGKEKAKEKMDLIRKMFIDEKVETFVPFHR